MVRKNTQSSKQRGSRMQKPRAKSKSKSKVTIGSWTSSKKAQALLITAIVAVIGGGYFLYQSLAATRPDYRVRFIAVVPRGTNTPTWATSAHVKANAVSMQSWYTKKVGKSFHIATGDSLNYRVLPGSRTLADYQKCPAGTASYCNSAIDAITLNLDRDYGKPGFSTVIFFAARYPINGAYGSSTGMSSSSVTNVTDPQGRVKNSGLVAVQLAGAGGYIGDARARRYAAHELGHTMGLNHRCNRTLMNKGQGVDGCPYIATEWPSTPLDSYQASQLNKNSPFFNDFTPTFATVTNTDPIRTSSLSIVQSNGEGCQLAGRGWDKSTGKCTTACLVPNTKFVKNTVYGNGYCAGAIQVNTSTGTMTAARCNELGRRWVNNTGCSRQVDQGSSTLHAIQCITYSDRYYVPANNCKP